MGTIHATSFLYHRAGDLSDAVDALGGAAHPAVLAGGQSLVPALRGRRRRPDLVVDIGRIPGLGRVDEPVGHGTLVAGATASQSEVLAAAQRSGHGLLAAALATVGTPLTRRRGTIGGILAQGDPALQLSAVCNVLDVSVAVRGPGRLREVGGGEFFTGRRLGPSEILTRLLFRPCGDDEGWGFSSLAHRRTGPQVAGAAARVTLDAEGRCTSARVAAYTLGHRGGPLAEAAAHLIGRRPARDVIDEAARAAAAAAGGTSDALASAAYRRHAVRILVGRALVEAVRRVHPHALHK